MLWKNRHTCGLCGTPGHNRRSCPNGGKLPEQVVILINVTETSSGVVYQFKGAFDGEIPVFPRIGTGSLPVGAPPYFTDLKAAGACLKRVGQPSFVQVALDAVRAVSPSVVFV